MDNIDTKHQLYHQVSIVGRALGHETRLELIEILAQSPRTVEVLASLISTDLKSVSNHLQILARAGLVTAAREGRCQRYALSGAWVADLAVTLRAAAEKALESLAELDRQIRADADVISMEEAAARVEAGRMMLVDVRPASEYAAGHIPGALHAEGHEIEALALRLPEGTELGAYCRGPYCFLARDAAQALAKKGRTLHIVRDGVMEWRARGGELETSADASAGGGSPVPEK